uniref:Uncharacterized protein n=1 Tax=Romanomermis culicivorax TaxID=13658 RepID=A0A915JKV1_ROMCU
MRSADKDSRFFNKPIVWFIRLDQHPISDEEDKGFWTLFFGKIKEGDQAPRLQQAIDEKMLTAHVYAPWFRIPFSPIFNYVIFIIAIRLIFRFRIISDNFGIADIDQTSTFRYERNNAPNCIAS